MAGDKVEMPEVLVSKSSDGSFTAKHEKGILEFPDDSKDQAVSENTIPLSPQWLYAKPSEVRVGLSAVPMDARVPNVSLHRSSADFVQKDRWRQDVSQDKKDWRRFIPDVESSQRWREEERETGLLGRKDHRNVGETEYRKNDRRVDNTSVGEITDTKNLAQSERRNDVIGRSCLAEGRRDSKWSSRWGPDDKEDPRAEKKSDIDKEYCNNEKHSLVASSRVLAEPESHEKWRPRHRQEVQSGGSTVYRAAPGFGLERGRVDGPSIRTRSAIRPSRKKVIPTIDERLIKQEATDIYCTYSLLKSSSSTTFSYHPVETWKPMAIRKMASRPKKMAVWMRMETPLVWKFPNSINLFLPGSWNRSPGDSNTNNTTATSTGPQSATIISLF